MLKMEEIYIEEDLLVDPTLQMHNFGHLKVLCPLDMLINTELILKIPNADFITRSAPGLGNNSGGAIEIVTNPNGVKLDSFNMIGE